MEIPVNGFQFGRLPSAHPPASVLLAGRQTMDQASNRSLVTSAFRFKDGFLDFFDGPMCSFGLPSQTLHLQQFSVA